MINKFFRNSVFVAVVVIGIVGLAQAQDAPDRFKISASFSNTELKNLFGTNVSQSIQGITAEADARVFKYEGLRLGGVFQYSRPQIDAAVAMDTYSFGPQASADLLKGFVSPFGRVLFGVTTDYNGSRAFTRTYGFGADINLGHVFIRPFTLDFINIEGAAASVQKYSAGAGFRF